MMFKFRLESGLLSSDLSLIEALEATSLAFFVKNSRLQYIHSSESLKALLNVNDMLGKCDLDIYLPEIAAEQEAKDRKVLTTHVADHTESVVITVSNVQKILKIERSIYLKDDESYVVGVLRDVTEEKQNQQYDSYKKVLSRDDIYEQVINRFSGYIFNTRDEHTIIEGVTELFLDVMDVEDVSIFLYDAESNTLSEKTAKGRTNPEEYQRYKPLELSLGQGIVGAAAQNMQVICLDRVEEDKRYIKTIHDSRSELAVPIVHKKELIGVINAENARQGAYNDRHIRLFEHIASLLAIKLHELRQTQSIQRKKKQFQAFVENSPVSLAMLDRSFNYLAVSQKWKSTYELPRDMDMTKLNHFDLNPNIPIRWKKNITRALNGESGIFEKEFYQRKNGERVWYNAHVSPWYDEHNRIGGVIIHADIITDMVVEQEKTKTLLEELIEARKHGNLFTWEYAPESGEFIWKAGRLQLEDAVESSNKIQSLFDLIDQDYKADFNSALYQAVERKENLSFIHPVWLNGEKLWVHTRGVILGVNGKILKIHGSAQNITEQIQIEESLKKKNEELQKTNYELDQFVYKTAHDLRTPLTTLMGLVDVMRNEEDLQILKSYFDLQSKTMQRMDGFIQKIGHFTRNSRMNMDPVHINIYQMIDDILSKFLYYDRSENVLKSVHIELENEIYTEKERLINILSNLISNAIKFSDPDKHQSTMDIDVSDKNNTITIRISDNGLGMSEKVRGRALDMFYRGHKRADGLGIGLYLVKEAVSKLNGKISLISDLDKGTVVEIRLPNLNPKLINNGISSR